MRLDDVLGPRFVIAASTPEVFELVDKALATRWTALEGQFIVVQPPGQPAPSGIASTGPASAWEERDGLLTDWLRERGAVAVVARPDRYVFGIASSADELQRLVKELLDAVAPSFMTCAA